MQTKNTIRIPDHSKLSGRYEEKQEKGPEKDPEGEDAEIRDIRTDNCWT